MSLTPGTQLGPYEILAAIGAGGMGEVHYSWTDEANPFLHGRLVNRSPLLPFGEKAGVK